MIKTMVVGFCSIGGRCYFGCCVQDLRTLAQFQRGEMSPGLLQDILGGYIKV